MSVDLFKLQDAIALSVCSIIQLLLTAIHTHHHLVVPRSPGFFSNKSRCPQGCTNRFATYPTIVAVTLIINSLLTVSSLIFVAVFDSPQAQHHCGKSSIQTLSPVQMIFISAYMTSLNSETIFNMARFSDARSISTTLNAETQWHTFAGYVAIFCIPFCVLLGVSFGVANFWPVVVTFKLLVDIGTSSYFYFFIERAFRSNLEDHIYEQQIQPIRFNFILNIISAVSSCVTTVLCLWCASGGILLTLEIIVLGSTVTAFALALCFARNRDFLHNKLQRAWKMCLGESAESEEDTDTSTLASTKMESISANTPRPALALNVPSASETQSVSPSPNVVDSAVTTRGSVADSLVILMDEIDEEGSIERRYNEQDIKSNIPRCMSEIGLREKSKIISESPLADDTELPPTQYSLQVLERTESESVLERVREQRELVHQNTISLTRGRSNSAPESVLANPQKTLGMLRVLERNGMCGDLTDEQWRRNIEKKVNENATKLEERERRGEHERKRSFVEVVTAFSRKFTASL